MPSVSIIMPAFNAETYIQSSIQSVTSQTFPDWELVVIDDGSTDTTAQIVKQLQALDNRIKYLYQHNKRLGAARNTGIRAARGEWIAFLDSDDQWMPHKLETQLQAAKDTNADLVFSSGYYLYEDSQQLAPYDSLTGVFSGIDLYRQIFRHNYIPVLSVMIKAACVRKVGLQEESPKAYGCEDWDYWLRCCRCGASSIGLSNRTFTYRVHDAGMSRNILNMRMAGCYVLFKNFDASLFSTKEQLEMKERLVNEVRFIVHALYEKKEPQAVPYYLQLLGNLYKSTWKYAIAAVLVKLLRQSSKRLALFIIYH